MTRNDEFLYETNTINKDGVNGSSYVNREDGLKVEVSSPLNDSPGTNPEELLGLSLSTCFNATIHAMLEDQNLINQSKVEVLVQLKKEPNEPGYYFEVVVLASIEGLPIEQAEEIIHLSGARCPVFKLVQGSHTVNLKTVSYTK